MTKRSIPQELGCVQRRSRRRRPRFCSCTSTILQPPRSFFRREPERVACRRDSKRKCATPRHPSALPEPSAATTYQPGFMKRTLSQIVLLLGFPLVITASNASLQSSAISIEHRPLSSTVWATIAVNDRGTELAVLWRGRSGWYTGRPRSEHASGNAQSVSVSLQYGPTSLALSLDRRTREVTAGSIHTTLPPGANTILIDHVDEPNAISITGFTTLQLTATMTNGSLAAALSRSSNAVSFLQCDQGSGVLARVVCSQISGQQ